MAPGENGEAEDPASSAGPFQAVEFFPEEGPGEEDDGEDLEQELDDGQVRRLEEKEGDRYGQSDDPDGNDGRQDVLDLQGSQGAEDHEPQEKNKPGFDRHKPLLPIRPAA
jgi:hypothetical protein